MSRWPAAASILYDKYFKQIHWQMQILLQRLQHPLLVLNNISASTITEITNFGSCINSTARPSSGAQQKYLKSPTTPTTITQYYQSETHSTSCYMNKPWVALVSTSDSRHYKQKDPTPKITTKTNSLWEGIMWSNISYDSNISIVLEDH